jgi:hypothetical protein
MFFPHNKEKASPLPPSKFSFASSLYFVVRVSTRARLALATRYMSRWLLLVLAILEKATHAQIVSDADYHRNFGTFNAFNEEKCQAHLDLSKNSIDDATGKIIVQAIGASFPARYDKTRQ